MTTKDRKISVRLDPEADSRLREAISNGYTTSRYINDLIKGTTVADIGQCRQLILHLCQLNSILEFAENSEEMNTIKTEVQQLWRSLKSFQGNT